MFSFHQPLLGRQKMKRGNFFTISMLLGILWVAGFLVFHVASVLIHMLLVLAVLFYVGHLVSDASTT
jgi:hypothetical protein